MEHAVKERTRGLSWRNRFWATVKYELLWNTRKKKVLAMVAVAFGLATLSLTLPVLLSNTGNASIRRNPDFVVSGAGFNFLGYSGFSFFLFALATVMNTFSEEFESGSIITLLTKPISRTMIFLGKLCAAYLTILATYVILYVYVMTVGTIVYGPQNNLYLLPIHLLGSIVSTLIWVSIALALGSIFKSSLIVLIGTLGIFFAIFIISPIVLLFSEQAWVLTYVPGNGAYGYIKGLSSQAIAAPGLSVSTGTDSIGANSVYFILHPLANVTFFRIGPSTSPEQLLERPPLTELYTESLSLVYLRSLGVAAIYIVVFAFIAWYVFRRAEVLE